MTCIISGYPTKKALREAVEKDEVRIQIEDPSIVRPRVFYVQDIDEGEEIVATNHPKRSWFAQIGRKGGKLYVK